MAEARTVINMEQIREIADLQARVKTVENHMPAIEKQQVDVGILTVTVGRVEGLINNINESVIALNKTVNSLEHTQKATEQNFVKMDERFKSFDGKFDKLAEQINQKFEEQKNKINAVDEKSKVDLITGFKGFMGKHGVSLFMVFVAIGAVIYSIVK